MTYLLLTPAPHELSLANSCPHDLFLANPCPTPVFSLYRLIASLLPSSVPFISGKKYYRTSPTLCYREALFRYILAQTAQAQAQAEAQAEA